MSSNPVTYPIVYVILDTKTGSLFKTDNGKMVWRMQGHAKNAWNHHFYREKDGFGGQDRYTVVPCQLTPVENQ